MKKISQLLSIWELTSNKAMNRTRLPSLTFISAPRRAGYRGVIRRRI